MKHQNGVNDSTNASSYNDASKNIIKVSKKFNIKASERHKMTSPMFKPDNVSLSKKDMAVSTMSKKTPDRSNRLGCSVKKDVPKNTIKIYYLHTGTWREY